MRNTRSPWKSGPYGNTFLISAKNCENSVRAKDNSRFQIFWHGTCSITGGIITNDAFAYEVFALPARVNPDVCATQRLLKLAPGMILGVCWCVSFVDSIFYLE
jgi:hypothetical protein